MPALLPHGGGLPHDGPARACPQPGHGQSQAPAFGIASFVPPVCQAAELQACRARSSGARLAACERVGARARRRAASEQRPARARCRCISRSCLPAFRLCSAPQPRPPCAPRRLNQPRSACNAHAFAAALCRACSCLALLSAASKDHHKDPMDGGARLSVPPKSRMAHQVAGSSCPACRRTLGIARACQAAINDGLNPSVVATRWKRLLHAEAGLSARARALKQNQTQ